MRQSNLHCLVPSSQTQQRGRSNLASVVLMVAALVSLVGAVWWATQGVASEDVLAEQLQDRQSRVASLSPHDKQTLQRQWDRFLALSPERQQQIRLLHEQLSSDPQEAQLRAVLSHYYDWLRTLSPAERATLLELPPEAQVAHIREAQQRQEGAQFRRLVDIQVGTQDLQQILDWHERFLTQQEEAVLACLPEQVARRVSQEEDDAKRLRMLAFITLRQRGQEGFPRFSEEDIRQLRENLSVETGQALDQARNLNQQVGIVQEWVRAALLSRYLGTELSEERLEEFFLSLAPSARERLERLPREQMQRELRRRYIQHYWRQRAGQQRRGDASLPDGSRESERTRPPHHREGHSPEGRHPRHPSAWNQPSRHQPTQASDP